MAPPTPTIPSKPGHAVGRELAAFTLHLVFVAGLVAVVVRLGLRSWHQFLALHAEDGAVETLTVVLFLFTAFLAHLVALQHRQAGSRALAWLHWVGALAFFFIGMEEMSWGQRLLLLETPEALAAVNMQQELNLHNLPLMHGVNQIRVCLVLGAFGVFSSAALLLGRRVRGGQKRWGERLTFLEHFTVPVRYVPYFLALFVYIVLRRNDSALLYELKDRRLIKELMEMLFALGCYFVMFHRLRACHTRALERALSRSPGPAPTSS